MKKICYQILFTGAPRGGKSFFCEKMAREYARAGKIPLVYNTGKPSDFEDFEYIKIMSLQFHEQQLTDAKEKQDFRMYPELKYFEFRGMVWEIKDFCEVCKGCKIKMNKIQNARLERLFFQSVSDYFAGVFLILEDTRSLFRHGLKEELTYLLSRINHTGEKRKDSKRGTDVALLFHSLDFVNAEFYIYITHMVMFHNPSRPNLKNKVEDEELKQTILEAWETVKNLPKYSRAEIALSNPQIFKTFKPKN